MNSIGTRMNSICSIGKKPTLSWRPRFEVDSCALNLKASKVSNSDTMPITQAAAILPLTIALRGAGVASKGSSDWRSRSPAVASRISEAPPRNDVITSSTGSSIAIICPRLASAVARSCAAISSGLPTCASMPRASRRSAPTCWL